MSRGVPFVVRRLSPSEIESMVDLWRESGLSYKPKGRDGLKSLHRQRRISPDLFLGAFVGEGMVGTVIASDDGRRGWINRLAVRPSARRAGVASALIVAAERALRRRRRHLFCVHVESDNGRSMELFEAMGYSREKEIFYYTKRERKSY